LKKENGRNKKERKKEEMNEKGGKGRI